MSDAWWQDKTWTDAEGNVWPVEKMRSSHRRNVIAWFERNKARLELADSLRYLNSDFMPSPDTMAYDDIFDGLAEQTPDEWLASLPIYRRLCELEGIVLPPEP